MTAARIHRVRNLSRLTPSEKKRRQKIILVVVLIFVGITLVIDGYLLGRYLNRQHQLVKCQTTTSCIIPKPLVTGQIVAAEEQLSSLSLGFDAIYYHDVLGMSISYPSDWGEVLIAEEYGRTIDDRDIIVGLTLSFDGQSEDDAKIFLHATNPNTEPVTRNNYYWGSAGEMIKNSEDVMNWCDGTSNCDTFVNQKGLVVARTEETVEGANGAKYDRRIYYTYNPVGGYNGVVMSAEQLHGRGIENLEETFEDVVDWLSPLYR